MVKVARIEDALRILALNNRYRFNAHQVAYMSGNQDVNAVYEYLKTREPFVLKRSFEVMCPNYHSTASYSDPSEIPYKWTECRVCPEEFIPTPDMIHIVFDFQPGYLAGLQEVIEEKKSSHSTVMI